MVQITSIIMSVALLFPTTMALVVREDAAAVSGPADPTVSDVAEPSDDVHPALNLVQPISLKEDLTDLRCLGASALCKKTPFFRKKCCSIGGGKGCTWNGGGCSK